MPRRPSFHKRQLRRREMIALGLISVFIGWYALGRLIVIKGSISITDQNHEYEIWLDGNPANLVKTDAGWLIKTTAGQHTLTFQNSARQESKILVKVHGNQTATVTPAASGQISSEDAAFIGSASYVRLSADGKYIYYLNRDARVMRRYNIETGANVAISDDVFRSPSQISFSPDDGTVVMRSTGGSWYSFDFRKTDFTTSSFVFLADKNTVSLAYDPSRFRLAYIKPEQSGGPLALYTTEADLSNPELKFSLTELRSPRLIWAPHGRQIVTIDDPSYNKDNLRLLDLSSGEQTVVAISNTVRAEYSSDGQWLLVEEARGAARWLQIVNTETHEVREIGQLRQSELAAWRPLENEIWACLEGTDKTVISGISPDGSRRIVGQVPELPGVWQKIIPTLNSSDLLVESSYEIWRLTLSSE